jgi:hypothetical protein
MTTTYLNINPHTIQVITGVKSNPTPKWNGLHSQLEFEKNTAIQKIKDQKKTLSPTRSRELFLKNSGYKLIYSIDRNVFKKTPEEKFLLKRMKAHCKNG